MFFSFRRLCLLLLVVTLFFPLMLAASEAGSSNGLSAVEAGEVQNSNEMVEQETVVVTATRSERLLSDAPYSVEVIDRRTIEASGARTLAEILARNTNIYVYQTFAGVGVEMQGLSPEYTAILVDGQKLPGRVGGVIDLSRIPIANVERIEIVQGASSALYGADALAGVINIITREEPEPFLLKGEFGYGLDKSLDATATAGTRFDWGATQFAMGGRVSPGFDLVPTDVATNGSAYEQFNLSNRTHFGISELIELEQRVDYVYRDQRAVDLRPSGAVLERANRTETFSFLLSPKLNLSNSSELSLTTSYSMFRDQYLLDQRNSTTLDTLEETWEHLFAVALQWNTRLWIFLKLIIS